MRVIVPPKAVAKAMEKLKSPSPTNKMDCVLVYWPSFLGLKDPWSMTLNWALSAASMVCLGRLEGI